MAKTETCNLFDVLHGDNRLPAESGMCISGTGYGEFTTVTVNAQIHAEPCYIGENSIGHGNFRKQIFCLLDLFLKLDLFAVILFHKGIRIFVKLTAAFDDVHSLANIENSDNARMKTETVKKLGAELSFLGVAGTDKNETGRVANTDTFAFNNVFTACGNVEQNVDKMVIKEVNLVNIEEAAVCLGKKAGFKCFYTAGKRLFDIDSSANTVFGSAKRKVTTLACPHFGQLC